MLPPDIGRTDCGEPRGSDWHGPTSQLWVCDTLTSATCSPLRESHWLLRRSAARSGRRFQIRASTNREILTVAVESLDAFISYSRSVSAPLAVDLQVGLERFAKPWNRLRAVRVFRDDSSMAANSALWSTIVSGLADSGWFVLLATPEAARSEYVNNEVAWWVTNKGADGPS